MNYMLYALILVFQVSFTSNTFGQTKPIYKVISLPRNCKYDIKKLNNEISTLNTRQQILNIIVSHKELVNVPITIRIKKDLNTFSWWQINPNSPSKEGDFTVLQSKGPEVQTFYTKASIQRFFQDTLVVLDTLKLTLYLQDQDLSISKYFIKSKENQNKTFVPHDDSSTIFITSLLFGKKRFNNEELFNEDDSVEALAALNLHFLTQQEKNTLLSIAKDFREELPNINCELITEYVQSFVRKNYGKISTSTLSRFLASKNN